MNARTLSVLATLTLGLLAFPGLAAADPVLEVTGRHAPTTLLPESGGTITFIITNVGDTTADPGYDDGGTPGETADDTLTDPITIDLQLPPGVTTRIDNDYAPEAAGEAVHNIPFNPPAWVCPDGPDIFTPGAGSVRCEMTIDSDSILSNARPDGTLPPGQSIRFHVFVEADSTVSGTVTAEATVSGGGASPVIAEEAVEIGDYPTKFGVEEGTYRADAFDSDGVPERQAGAHPLRAITAFDLNTEGRIVGDYLGYGTLKPAATPLGSLHSVGVDLPRGFVGNPGAVARCTNARLLESNINSGFGTNCPPESQIGTLELTINALGGLGQAPAFMHVALYNMVPPPGAVADLGASVIGAQVHIRVYVDPVDHSVTARLIAANEFLTVHGNRVTIWGVPGDPAHDGDRWNPNQTLWGAPFLGEVKPFISLPTACGVAESTEFFGVSSWADPGNALDPFSTEPVAAHGCDRLVFEPTVEARPTTNIADSPAGLEFEMDIPQNEDPEGLATPHLRDAVVKLPEGMTVNPPSADGLGACSMEQLGITPDGVSTSFMLPVGVRKATPVNCPESSKLGSVEAISPALEKPITGSAYLAEQNDNPFGSMLAMYLVLEDEERGLRIKLSGRIDADPRTGQLTATFKDNPQLPVEELTVKLKEGPRAPLKTPATCGIHTTTSTLTPWSAPEGASASPTSSFELTRGPGGGACLPGGGSAPNNPAFSAGTLDPTAKAFSPFVLKLARADGTQPLKAIDTTLPKGLVAKLAGTTYCSDAALAAAAGKSGKAERASSSCPTTSRVGSVDVGAGAGTTPLYVQGQAYLAGPYKGAPLSLAIITPAVAGPFDLGTVVVRTALQVNPESAQVRAVSDELPTILQGIPLNVRSVAVKMDRPEFTLNPTSCDPMSVDGSALTVFGQSAALTNRFQVGECNRLGFKPKLAMSFSGSTRRSGYPALKAVLTARPGDANIGRAQVTLPKTELLEQAHIRTICTRVQYAAKACPKGAVYGYAKAWTPLLDQPLEGPVYLRSSSNKLPDLVADLNGQLEVDLIGRIDSVKARIRNTFEVVPDAPVSKFVLTMQGGQKGLLVNNTNLCKAKPRLEATFEAQNGKLAELTPLVKTDCGKKGRKGKGKKRGGK